MVRYLAKIVIVLLVIVLCFFIASSIAVLLRPYREYRVYQMKEQDYIEKVKTAEIRLEDRKEYLELIQNDPDFLEHVVRERLGYVRDNEQVFRFETPEK
jgi:cell division protein FtsB